MMQTKLTNHDKEDDVKRPASGGNVEEKKSHMEEKKSHVRTAANRMTSGPIGRQILAFAFPLFLGNLFQQLYNTADSLIVGNFIGSNALAAVSSSGSLIFLMVGFFAGVSAGAGVVIARYFGAKDSVRMERAIHTTVAFGIVAVLPSSILYFRVYFCGSLAFVLYNICVGIMQSVGDSRHPLYYLVFSSMVNIVLDLLFVAVLHMGVGSAALATVISQFLSVTLCLFRLTRVKEEYCINIRRIRFDLPMLREVVRNGLPTGFQNSIIALANVVVQSNINAFGKMAVAGCGSYSKIEGFGFLPINCFVMALTTFISQNLGAREYERVKKGTRFGILCSVCIAELVGIAIYVLSPYLIAGFNSDPEVVAFGVTQAHTVTLFYFLLAYSHCLAAIFRGAGHSGVPMVVMLVCWCIVRVSYITLIVRFIPKIGVIFFFKADWMHNRSGVAS